MRVGSLLLAVKSFDVSYSVPQILMGFLLFVIEKYS